MATQDTVSVPKIIAGNVSGPASYAAGGFDLDLSAEFASLLFIKLIPETLGVLMPVEPEILLNRSAAGAVAHGEVAIKLMRERYDKTTIGNVSGQPGGVTVQAALSANSTSTHIHSIAHDHGAVTSGAMAQAGAGSTAGASPDALGHVHSVTIPASAASTSNDGSHTHNRAFEYQHGHALGTVTDTAVTLTEVANATDLSGVTWRYIAFGWGEQ